MKTTDDRPLIDAPALDLACETTSQEMLFPVHRHAYDGSADNALPLEKQLYSIKDDLLYQWITYGDGAENKAFKGLAHHKGIGYAFLAFFVQKALDIYRYPFFPDRTFCHLIDEQKQIVIDTVNALSASRVSRICHEIIDIYQHAQDLLALKQQDSVRLQRRITGPEDCPTMVRITRKQS